MNQSFRILVISNYPSDTRPAYHVFVHTLLREVASLGVDTTVVAPEPLWNLAKAKGGNWLGRRIDVRDGITVCRPRYLSLSRFLLPLLGSTYRWTVQAYANAVLQEAKLLNSSFDVCMAHFLYPQGFAAVQVGTSLTIPVVVSLGESNFNRYESSFSRTEISQLLAQFAGVITNSRLIQEQCSQRYQLDATKIQTLPNGVDPHRFYPRDQKEARQQCGLPADRPIVISVGHLIERKGPLRVLESIKARPDIGAVFLGTGPQVPTGPQVLYQGEVPHEEVPIWLSAADLLVLPTLDEGCSNALLEALFCGLPVVSSDRPFNYSILNEEVAILVDPYDVEALGNAISLLIDQPKRRMVMGQAALQHSRTFHLNDRAKRVLAFLQQAATVAQRHDQ